MTDPFIKKARLVRIYRAQSENGLGENDMPVDRLHPAGFKKSFVSLDVVRAQVRGHLCRRVIAQIGEKPEVGT